MLYILVYIWNLRNSLYIILKYIRTWDKILYNVQSQNEYCQTLFNYNLLTQLILFFFYIKSINKPKYSDSHIQRIKMKKKIQRTKIKMPSMLCDYPIFKILVFYMICLDLLSVYHSKTSIVIYNVCLFMCNSIIILLLLM